MVLLEVPSTAPSIQHQIVVGQGCKNSRHLVIWETKFFTVAPNILAKLLQFIFFTYKTIILHAPSTKHHIKVRFKGHSRTASPSVRNFLHVKLPAPGIWKWWTPVVAQ